MTKNPYNPDTEPASYKWFEEKPQTEGKKPEVFTDQSILDRMESDLIEDGFPVGHAVSILEHWRNIYLITIRKP